MAKEHEGATEHKGAPAGSSATDASETSTPAISHVQQDYSEVKKPEDLADMPHTPEHRRALAHLTTDIKVPSDLSKVSVAKAKELAEAGLVDDHDLPGKMYRRKSDGFVTRIPDYTFEAYAKDLQDEWEEIKLPTAEPKPAE